MVEDLLIHCALGHDRQPTGDVEGHVHDVAAAFASLAQDEMRLLHHVNEGLVAAGRAPQLGRAASIGQAAGPDIALVPASPAERPAFIDRAQAIATAVDARYARLAPARGRPAVRGRRPAAVAAHLRSAAGSRSRVARLPADAARRAHAAQVIRARRRDPADVLEEGLLALSERFYGLTVDMVATWFAHEDDFGLAGSFRGLSQSCMQGLNDANALLVARGLLPAFTPPH